MAWFEDNGVDYVVGLPGSNPLSKKIDDAADAVRTERAISDKQVVRDYAEARHKARRQVACASLSPLVAPEADLFRGLSAALASLGSVIGGISTPSPVRPSSA